MKYTLLLIALFQSFSFAAECSREPAYAMSPYKMECEEFKTSCDIPDDWIIIATCDISKIANGMPLNEIKDQKDSILNLRKEQYELLNQNGKSGGRSFFLGD